MQSPINLSIFSEKFPVIELDNVVLRQINSKKDAPYYYQYMSDDIMKNYITLNNLPQTIEYAEKELEYWENLFNKKQTIYFAIALKENDELIGTIGFNYISFVSARADIGYDLSYKYWGRSIMSKSMKAFIDFAENKMNITRIQANVIESNIRSIKLLEKYHFNKEGYMEKFEIVNGKYENCFLFARINNLGLIYR